MLVSVIIPCYNVEDYINECVNSVLNQTHKEIEIICIDNNSSDKTWEFLVDLKGRYPHIVIDKELKPGAPAARNKGLDLANGDWIQFLDADDLLVNTKIEHQLKLLLKNNLSDVAFISAACKRVNLDSCEEDVLGIEPNIYIAPFINKCGNTCSNLWRKQDIIFAGKWNEGLKSSQETDLMMRLIFNSKIYLIDIEPLTIIRERASGQISQRNPSEKWKQYIDVRLNYIKQLKTKLPNEYSKIKGMLYDFLMVSIITLGKYDKFEAKMYYQKYIKNEWHSAHTFGFNKLKVKLIKLFGIQVMFLK